MTSSNVFSLRQNCVLELFKEEDSSVKKTVGSQDKENRLPGIQIVFQGNDVVQSPWSKIGSLE